MQIEFYKVVSQIIPILFLAISLQSIFILKGEKYDKTENFQRNIHIVNFVLLVFTLVLGEFAALRSIYQNTTSLNNLIMVSLSMLFAVFWIIAEYILALIDRSKQIYYVSFMLIGLLLNIIIFIRL